MVSPSPPRKHWRRPPIPRILTPTLNHPACCPPRTEYTTPMRRRPLLLVLALLLLPAPAAHAQKKKQRPPYPADEALSTFKVADGLELSLFASEPMFVNPTSIDVDHK